MRLFDYLVVGGLIALAGLFISSIFLPELNVLFGHIFDNFQNTFIFCIGLTFIVVVIARAFK